MIRCERLRGRIAAVTGSTGGIGLAVARRLALEGAKVIVSSRKEENVQKAVLRLRSEGLDVRGVVCHVSNAEQRGKLFEAAREWGGLDILVSNAGASPVVSEILDTDERAWDKIFDVNVKSNFLLAKEAYPLLRQSRAGRIIFCASPSAYRPLHYAAAYSVSKTALVALTKAIAQQAAADGVTANAVSPGVVRGTKFAHVLTRDDELVEEEALRGVPLARLGAADEIAAVFAFLASDDGSYVTGENVCATGGADTRL